MLQNQLLLRKDPRVLFVEKFLSICGTFQSKNLLLSEASIFLCGRIPLYLEKFMEENYPQAVFSPHTQ
jgi:hypothetical protein